jgi:hypothetical protein
VQWTSSVPKKDVCPISYVVPRSVEVAAVVQATCPVHSLTIEVLLVEGCLLLATRRMIHDARLNVRAIGHRELGELALLALHQVVAILEALLLHVL